MDDKEPCYFVAYVYPGWHHSPFRPGFDEWSLLDNFKAYFEGHQPPARPLDGPYDDEQPATAARQILLAKQAGISAFTYFLYFGEEGFTMTSPIEVAIQIADNHCFSVGTTWCLRLPHNVLPIPVAEDGQGSAPAKKIAGLPVRNALTIGDVAGLFSAAEREDIELGTLHRLIALNSHQAIGGTKDVTEQ